MKRTYKKSQNIGKKESLRTYFESYPKDAGFYDPETLTEAFEEHFGTNTLRYEMSIGFLDIVQLGQDIAEVFFIDDPTLYNLSSTPKTKLLQQVKDMLDRYTDGERVDFRDIPVDIFGGTEFQHSVWKTIYQIPYGEVRSYKWIAEQVGRPKAVRAVGNATGSNPITIIIPCHRVIGSSGNLGGYGGGLERKRQLLSLEGYPVKELKSTRKVSSK